MESKIQSLATKNDISLLREELFITKDDLRKEMSDLRRDIGESKANTIKWMFVFWIGQIGATVGIVMLFLKK